MKRILRVVCALVLSCVLEAQATTFGTDASDLWWNPNESGWGVNVVQQNEVLFLTFFVYGPNNQPIWYVGSNVSYAGQSGSSPVFSGPLYQTNGPWFGGTFNPALFGFRQAGTITFTLTSVSSANVTYTVDGVTVVKQVVRQTWRTEYIGGDYILIVPQTLSNCTPSSGNGYTEELGFVSITQSGSLVNMQLTGTGANGSTVVCNYAGTYTQAGRMGGFAGSYSCSNALAGNFQAFEWESNPQGFTARVAGSNNACSFTGRMVGTRRYF